MTMNVRNEGWSQVEKRFDELAVDGKLHKTYFSQCLGMRESKEFANQLFDALARRRGLALSSISKDELHEFWEQITDQSFDSRLLTFFDMVDKSAGGRFSKEKVKEIFNLSASANNLSKIQGCAEEYAALIMEELDPDNLGYIELYNLKMLVAQASKQSTQLTMDSNVGNRKVFLTSDHNPNPIKQGFQELAYFVEDNWKRFWVIALWLSICATLFTWKFIEYTHFTVVYHVMGYCVPLAKGIAETLKFNMALILLLVCKNSITWLRSRTKLGMVVPFDDNINFHKVIAFSIGTGVVLHTLTYVICIFPTFLHITSVEYEPLKPYFGDKRPSYWVLVNGIEGWTGIVMLVLMVITYILAHPWFRRSMLNLPTTLKKFTGFNSFWYTHHLYIIIYVLLIIHGYFLFLVKKWQEKTTWMYLIIPMIIYACERLLRLFRSCFNSVRILKVVIYPDQVLALHVSKPQGFKYIGGQYLYVNCPDVSTFEWHPFSITSAPGDNDLSLHVKTLGDWTSQLNLVFAKACQLENDDQCDVKQIEVLQANNKSRMPRILIDGPYGAPAQEYKNYEFLLLIGLGIGVTPSISILKDMLNNIKQQEDLEEGVINGGVKNKKREPFATKRAYLHWVTRSQGSLKWFKGIMNEVVDNDIERVIELNNYCTGAYEEGDAHESALISWLRSLYYDKKGVDIVSQTKIKTYSTRPNWHDVFKRIAIKHPDKRVGVFYCGACELAGELQRLSIDFSRRTNTKFDFHKENF